MNPGPNYTPPPPAEPQWEPVNTNTRRLEVPGGWLYEVLSKSNSAAGWLDVVNVVFVPSALP